MMYMLLLLLLLIPSSTVYAVSLDIEREYGFKQLYNYDDNHKFDPDVPCLAMGEPGATLMLRIVSFEHHYIATEEKCQAYVDSLTDYTTVYKGQVYDNNACLLEQICHEWILIKAEHFEKYKYLLNNNANNLSS